MMDLLFEGEEIYEKVIKIFGEWRLSPLAFDDHPRIQFPDLVKRRC
jgi:hypothetical protein